jgi:hypothetical protein
LALPSVYCALDRARLAGGAIEVVRSAWCDDVVMRQWVGDAGAYLVDLGRAGQVLLLGSVAVAVIGWVVQPDAPMLLGLALLLAIAAGFGAWKRKAQAANSAATVGANVAARDADQQTTIGELRSQVARLEDERRKAALARPPLRQWEFLSTKLFVTDQELARFPPEDVRVADLDQVDMWVATARGFVEQTSEEDLRGFDAVAGRPEAADAWTYGWEVAEWLAARLQRWEEPSERS